MRRVGWALWVIALVAATGLVCRAQAMPQTMGESLSGQQVVLAHATQGRRAILVAGFSREGGQGTGAWTKAVRTDPAMAGVPVYQIAMLAAVPGLFRGAIRNGMKKGLTLPEQDQFIVLTQDESLWRSYLHVTDDKDPYVVLLDAAGKMLWQGHGPAASLEPQLRATLR